MAIYFKAKRDAMDYFNNYPVVKDELLTPKERNSVARYLDDSVFEIIEISRKKTYKSFGARFEIKE